MASHVESMALVLDSPGNSPHVSRVRLQDQDHLPQARQFPGGRETGRTGPDDDVSFHKDLGLHVPEDAD